jgi:hypothetical protein
MDKRAAERQAAYRKRMQDRGYRLLQVWVDAEGFPGKAQERSGAHKQELTLDQLEAELVRLSVDTDEAFKARLFGELAAYAKGARVLRDLTRMSPELFNQEVLEERRIKEEKTPGANKSYR